MPSQPHVVFFNIMGTGHMNPTLPLVVELRARGCEVTYFVDQALRQAVEAAGAAWRPFRYPDGAHTGTLKSLTDAEAQEGVAKYVPSGTPEEEYAPLPHVLVLNAELVLPALLQDLRALQTKPSLIVYDPFLAFGPVAAHVLGVPAATTLTMPGPGVLAKPDAVVDEWEAKPWVQGPREEILSRYGIDVFKHGMQMEFYSPFLNLVTSLDELYLPPCPGRQQERYGSHHFRCVGLLTDPAVKRIANVNVKRDQALEELPMERIDAALKAGRHLLYISLGTVASSATFWEVPFGPFGKGNGLEDCTGKQLTQHVFRACFEAFGDSSEDAPLVVLPLGPQEDALEGLPEVPANFIVRQAVPQLEVLRRCSAFITHGGANSMHEALSLGVPMAVVPMFGDQPLNADSLVAIGAAISFREPLASVTPAALGEALGRLMEPSPAANPFRAAALGMARKLEAAGGVPVAVDALLEIALAATVRAGGA